MCSIKPEVYGFITLTELGTSRKSAENIFLCSIIRKYLYQTNMRLK